MAHKPIQKHSGVKVPQRKPAFKPIYQRKKDNIFFIHALPKGAKMFYNKIATSQVRILQNISTK